MEDITGFEDWLLDKLNPDQARSPEELLLEIEEQLDLGEITVEEAIQLLRDITC